MPTNTHDDQRPPRVRPSFGITNIHRDHVDNPDTWENAELIPPRRKVTKAVPCDYCDDTGIVDDMEENEIMVAHGHAGGFTQKCFYCKPTRKEK